MESAAVGINVSEIREWLLGEFATRLSAAVDGMTAERPSVAQKGVCAAPAGGFCWKQSFSKIPGAISISTEEQAWRDAGTWVLRAAGMDETPQEMKTEFMEIVRQTLAGVAQSITARLGKEVTPQDGAESENASQDVSGEWCAIEAELSGLKVTLSIGVSTELLGALVPPPEVAAPDAPALPETNSRTFDLLLDVELPVSISFGRAQVALKDVLKLTVGSIVELNRVINDPVEVIVNNCVIARGEVVVVDGNFGVRVQNVISKQERLRTLD